MCLLCNTSFFRLIIYVCVVVPAPCRRSGPLWVCGAEERGRHLLHELGHTAAVHGAGNPGGGAGNRGGETRRGQVRGVKVQ